MRFPATHCVVDRTREAWLYLWNLLRPNAPRQVRVVIFGQGRTGSTLLESLICSTGHFDGNGELLNIDRYGEILFPLQFVQGLAKWKTSNNFIFHVKVYQLNRDRRRPVEPASFLTALHDRGWRVIYLKRDNVIKHVLSNVVAEHRGAYHKYDEGTEESKKVVVDCERFAERVRERQRFAMEEQAALGSIDHHTVVYERDLQHAAAHQGTIDGVLDYLGLERRTATSRH